MVLQFTATGTIQNSSSSSVEINQSLILLYDLNNITFRTFFPAPTCMYVPYRTLLLLKCGLYRRISVFDVIVDANPSQSCTFCNLFRTVVSTISSIVFLRRCCRPCCDDRALLVVVLLILYFIFVGTSCYRLQGLVCTEAISYH